LSPYEVHTQLAAAGGGFIDKTGRMVIEPQWERTGYFSEGLVAVKRDKKWVFIDKSSHVVIERQFDDYLFAFSQGLAAVKQDG